jgi:hypothetical protein
MCLSLIFFFLLNIVLKISATVSSIDSWQYQNQEYDQIEFEIRNDSLKIGIGAFSHMPKLETIIGFPITITQIESQLFYNCSKLTSFSFSGQKNAYGQLIFHNKIKSLEDNAFRFTNFSLIKFSKFINILTIYEGCFSDMPNFLQVIDFPITVESIPDLIFYHCFNLSSFSFSGQNYQNNQLIFHDNIKYLDWGAFRSTSFSLIDFSKSSNIMNIYKECFACMSNLSQVINFPITVENIPDCIFDNCSHLSSFSFAGQNHQNDQLIFHDNIKSIDWGLLDSQTCP